MSDADPSDESASPAERAADEPPSSPAEEPGGLEPVPAPEAEPENPLARRVRLAEDRLQEVLGAFREMRAENEDYRERLARNVERRFVQRQETLLLRFIDVLDNLDRALEATQTSYASHSLVEGMILVRTHLLQTLQDEGLERIPVLGLPFDPNFSEAVATEPVKEAEQDHVVLRELLRGYRIHGRIARPSRVVVGAYEGAAREEKPAPAPEEPDRAQKT